MIEPTAPYPGALEDELAWHLVKYLAEDVRLSPDVEHTSEPAGAQGPLFFVSSFGLDRPYAAETTLRTVIEVGPHSTGLRDHDRLLRRDARLLQMKGAAVVYRFRGTDVLHRIDDLLYLVSLWDPSLFSERGRIALRTLASPEARKVVLKPDQPSVLVAYPMPDASEKDETPERFLWHVANGTTPNVLVRRLDAAVPAVWSPYASTF